MEHVCTDQSDEHRRVGTKMTQGTMYMNEDYQDYEMALSNDYNYKQLY